MKHQLLRPRIALDHIMTMITMEVQLAMLATAIVIIRRTLGKC